MKKEDYKKIAKNVIDLEIKALMRLKNSINISFNVCKCKIYVSNV